MDSRYALSADAQEDLFEIWCRIAEDSITLANRIEDEFYRLFASLARMPRQGHMRRDLTSRRVLFFPLYSFLVIYQPDPEAIRIVAVLRGRRNIERVLKERSIT
jgi:plasmid stabilization system protein ParE